VRHGFPMMSVALPAADGGKGHRAEHRPCKTCMRQQEPLDRGIPEYDVLLDLPVGAALRLVLRDLGSGPPPPPSCPSAISVGQHHEQRQETEFRPYSDADDEGHVERTSGSGRLQTDGGQTVFLPG
jgi:hypothetical protein